jgi:hypothetical protein
MYNMTFEWGIKCQWILSRYVIIYYSWQSDDIGSFIIGCVLTFLVSLISVGFAWIKKTYL